jgi:predicted CoA-binding protein
MPSNYERFWDHHSFAVVGNTEKKNFPVLTYRALRTLGKLVYPVDPSVEEVEGDRAYPDLESLPKRVDAVVLETPKEDTQEWVGHAAALGIRDLWIHMGRETPEAVELAKKRGINVRSGTCAVMYLTHGFSIHTVHKWIMKMIGRY